MLRSLRARLLLITGAVAGVALVAAALVSRLGVHAEYRQLETTVRGRSLTDAADLLTARLAASPSMARDSAAMDSALTHLASAAGQELILVGAGGRVVAASKPELRTVKIGAGPGGSIVVDRVEEHAGVQTVRRALLASTHPAVVTGPEGAPVGHLLPFPAEPGARVGGEAMFLHAVNRWLLIGVLGAGLLALLLSLPLSRRILEPIRALTVAARRMETGDLAARSPVRSRDEIGELSRAFNAMAESLERNEKLRRALVGDVAHELRTPLTNLRCQIEAIQDGLQPATSETLRSLHEETLLLGRLVDDLQDLALAEAGRLPLHRVPVAPHAAIDAALAAVAPGAVERRVRLESRVAPGLSDLDADPQRLGQILRNLLDNALTHVSEGGAIVVSAARSGAAVELAVADDGPGIAPEHLPHVFERFYRADPSRARSTGGAGLGLAIVRQLAAGHGGSVRVESEPGRGARFSVTLPAVRPS
jgi:signal transduction histidine kinase